MTWTVLKFVVALGAALLIYWTAAALIRGISSAPPGDDGHADLEPVNVRFECSVCGSRMTVTAAPGGELPSAPRHCMEEMSLVADYRSE